jgi:hypothetical protein
MAKYQVKTPLPAIWHKPGGQKESVTLPVGTVLEEASRHSATLEGKVGVYWEGRHYSVSLKDLLTKADPPRG